MTDYFQLLGLPRMPWLDAEDLKSRYHAVAFSHHPDRQGDESDVAKVAAGDVAASANAAFNALNNPVLRLAHLLELETGTKPAAVQQIPASVVDIAMQAASLAQQVDRFIGEKAQATSSIAQAQLMAKGFEWSDKLQALIDVLAAKRTALESQLRALNAGWERRASQDRVRELEELYRSLSFLSRWEQQLRSRVMQATL